MEHVLGNAQRSATRQPAWYWRVLASFGRLGVGTLLLLKNSLALLGKTIHASANMPRQEAVRQTFIMANRSLFFITVVMGFTGAIMVNIAATQMLRLVGDLTLVGPAFLQPDFFHFGQVFGVFKNQNLMISNSYNT